MLNKTDLYPPGLRILKFRTERSIHVLYTEDEGFEIRLYTSQARQLVRTHSTGGFNNCDKPDCLIGASLENEQGNARHRTNTRQTQEPASNRTETHSPKQRKKGEWREGYLQRQC